MIGKIFITRSGYDPELGKHVKDPYLGDKPSLGACRPDIRRVLGPGDQVFVVSGKIPGANQFVMAGFAVESKIDARQAYHLFPERRLRQRSDGQLTGNIIVDARGNQHRLDTHTSFDQRIQHYVIGTDLISLTTEAEITRGREQTLEALQEILRKRGASPIELIGRFGSSLTETQVLQLRQWLRTLKATGHDT